MDRIGHSACDQCTYCTEFCPRFLLGYEIEPHKVMRALGFSDIGSDLWNKYALLCCKCGICTLYACPEALYPREACMKGIEDLKKIDKGKWQGDKNVTVHPMREGRRLPLKMLMRRLGVIQYEAEAAYDDTKVNPKIVTIPLQQHIGAPAEPVVKAGETVQKGQAIARLPQDQLGSPIHSSIDGSVQEIKNKMVVIKG
jgi:Na+-translocating ferredoxin:NAD+ oxidoreductase RnfC subunit